ncbi:lipopolysaccharide biosynthesis protein [Teichococcus oryzae]|uniref:Oligosaccharide flippase family protein n=1 Tax=Teichococcus oryzae TaxID=1608942 RepID=A0A5B2TD76_9PROT|nr:oligosaccharide flippase family protein [Pseudoroseomonas oryzae]KAA2212043.1 oligosaccharide flippase family protein [Pseudoroseomonas oryzae]
MRFALRALSALLGATVLGSMVALATQILAARWLGAEAYGQFAALIVVANLATPVSSAGANWFLIQAWGEEGRAARRWVRPLARLVSATILLSMVMVCAYALPAEQWGGVSAAWAAAAGIAVLLGQAALELASARLQVERRFGTLAAWQAGAQVARFLALLAAGLAMGWHPTMAAVLAAYAAAGLAVAASGAAILSPLWPRRGEEASPGTREAVRRALPFSLMTVFYVVYFQSGVVLLEWQSGGAAAAAFNAALLLVAAASMLPQVVYMKFLAPLISRWAVHDRARFSAVFHVGSWSMLAAGAAGGVLLAVSGPWVLPLLFGPELAGAAPVLAVLALGLPLRFLQASYSAAFVSPAEVAMKVRYLGVAAACGLVANLALVPSMNAIGAALASVVAEAVLLGLHMAGAARAIKGIALRDLLRPSVPVASLRLLMRRDANAG